MTQATPKDYWISATALYIELNALGNPDYIQASCVSGAQILVYIKDIIGYDAGHNYRRWSLQAAPTVFNSHTAKYVYAAIPRQSGAGAPGASDKPALVVFPSEVIDIYGNNSAGTKIGSDEYYYINLGGIITSSGDNGTTNRDWQSRINTGLLSSDEALAAGPTDSDWYQYSTVDQITTFLKNLTMKANTIFINLFAHKLHIKSYGEEGGSITFDAGGSIEKVAEFGSLSDESPKQIVTPAYLKDREAKVEEKYLRKDQDDETKFGLTMASLKVNGKADVFGNLVAESTTHLKGNTVVGVSPSLPADMQHWGKSEWGTFIKGIITGTGAQIDINGNAELESLIIRRFLEVPELRYNRVSVHSGTEWFTKGSGLIESVEQIDDTHGKVKLHLEDGEISTIAEDDYCMGIFHNLNGNAEQTTDDKQGTMQYSGFCTVYFRIQEITETAHNSEFIYELRPCSDSWSHSYHPQPQMSFACYANPNNKDRQSAVLKTTDYTVYIENSTQWTFGPDNYYLIMGQLEGFSVWATNQAGQRYLKHLHGNGTMLGNVYMFGVIDQFDRLADTVVVTASPRINADYSLADGETMTLTAKMLSYDGIKRTGVVYNIKRYSDNPASDAEWNARRGNDIKDGTIALTTEDTRIDILPDDSVQGSSTQDSVPGSSTQDSVSGSSSQDSVPGSSFREEHPLYDPAVQFTITATRQLPTDEGGEDYSVERDIVVKNVGGFTLTDDLGYDIFIDPNESKVITFDVDSPRSGTVTQQVTSWHIERDSGDASADLTWNNSVKALTFRNPTLPHRIEIEQSDLSQIRDYTKFLITAYFNDTPIAQTEYTI